MSGWRESPSPHLHIVDDEDGRRIGSELAQILEQRMDQNKPPSAWLTGCAAQADSN